MNTWDYLAAHPDMTHAAYTDDATVMELFDRARLDPATMIGGTKNEQLMAAYGKHPTHWILFTIYSGYDEPSENGYAALMFAKAHYTQAEAYERFEGMFRHSGAVFRRASNIEYPEPKV